jgi:hypothetical protein
VLGAIKILTLYLFRMAECFFMQTAARAASSIASQDAGSVLICPPHNDSATLSEWIRTKLRGDRLSSFLRIMQQEYFSMRSTARNLSGGKPPFPTCEVLGVQSLFEVEMPLKIELAFPDRELVTVDSKLQHP